LLLELNDILFCLFQDIGKIKLEEYVIVAIDNSIDDNLQHEGVSECSKFIAVPWAEERNRFDFIPKSQFDWDRLHKLYQSVLRIIPGRSDFCNRKVLYIQTWAA